MLVSCPLNDHAVLSALRDELELELERGASGPANSFPAIEPGVARDGTHRLSPDTVALSCVGFVPLLSLR